jgi:hypothetical protein
VNGQLRKEQAISGNVQGAMFSHLLASRHLISSMRPKRATGRAWNKVNDEALGFSIELFTFLVSSNCITPYGVSIGPSPPLHELMLLPRDIASAPSCDAILAGCHELFHLIPEVSLLASRRLAEERAGWKYPGDVCLLKHQSILDRLTSWSIWPPQEGDCSELREQRLRVGIAFQQGLFIFLETAIAGSIVYDPAMLTTIQHHIDELFGIAPQLLESPYVAAVTWPFVIAGSCLTQSYQQQAFLGRLCSDRFGMQHLVILAKILTLVWDDPDPRAYGPLGIHIIMQKHGLYLSLA